MILIATSALLATAGVIFSLEPQPFENKAASFVPRGKGRQAIAHHMTKRRQKLARIGRQALGIAPLAFGIERVKRQAGFARARQPRDHHQLVARDVEVDVFEVVRARAADADALLAQGADEVGAVSGIGGT